MVAVYFKAVSGLSKKSRFMLRRSIGMSSLLLFFVRIAKTPKNEVVRLLTLSLNMKIRMWKIFGSIVILYSTLILLLFCDYDSILHPTPSVVEQRFLLLFVCLVFLSPLSSGRTPCQVSNFKTKFHQS
jgi:hypothetical protein